ncbi:hypothetical protein BC834DRAFT_872160 [Gloeopeniophorella convolvens]|nr:hypothetical protein BC834DRAFT_872160 [Gloeopeniophorella convolvens]
MSGFRTFAVVGAGNVGGFIVEELLKKKAAGAIDEIIIVTRPLQNQTFAARGVRIAPAEYADVSALTTALRGADVVISTISLLVIDAQVPVFVPSEFGGPTEKLEGLLAAKGALHERLREVGPPDSQSDIKSGKVAVGGDGNAPISWTARGDIARFLVHVLVEQPASRLQNQTLRIEGDRTSFNEIFSAYEERTGTKLEVTYRTLDDLRTKLAANPYDFDAYLHIVWVTDGLVGEPDNALFPEWNPRKVADILAPRKE